MTALKVGDRVTVEGYEGAGEIAELNGEVAIIEWDVAQGGRSKFGVRELTLDAPLPDAKFALGKALLYKRGRDKALLAIWAASDRADEAALLAGREQAKYLEAERRLARALALNESLAERAAEHHERARAAEALLEAVIAGDADNYGRPYVDGALEGELRRYLDDRDTPENQGNTE